jgi:hypothetical protein
VDVPAKLSARAGAVACRAQKTLCRVHDQLLSAARRRGQASDGGQDRGAAAADTPDQSGRRATTADRARAAGRAARTRPQDRAGRRCHRADDRRARRHADRHRRDRPHPARATIIAVAGDPAQFPTAASFEGTAPTAASRATRPWQRQNTSARPTDAARLPVQGGFGVVSPSSLQGFALQPVAHAALEHAQQALEIVLAREVNDDLAAVG